MLQSQSKNLSGAFERRIWYRSREVLNHAGFT